MNEFILLCIFVAVLILIAAALKSPIRPPQTQTIDEMLCMHFWNYFAGRSHKPRFYDTRKCTLCRRVERYYGKGNWKVWEE